MGVYYSLAYGVALTGQFGDKLKHIPQALFDFGRGPEDKDGGYHDHPEAIQSMPTEEGHFLVLGVDVNQGSDEGATWIEGEDTLKQIHAQYLELLGRCPEPVRALIQEHNLVPRLCVLAGNF